MFQSTHPHGVRPVEILYVQGGERFQSTHPHGVRPPYSIHYDFLLPVSIHAPTRGATGRYLPSGNIQLSFNPRTHTRCDLAWFDNYEITFNVSIHAPTRGATYSCLRMLKVHNIRFNPRTHTRCDLRSFGAKGQIQRVSIHAPTRGATIAVSVSYWCN